MKVPLFLLKEHLHLHLTPEEIADALTLAGIEVEGIELYPHPDIGPQPVLEISLTPNLGHCMSLYGIARELSAILNIPLKKRENPLREGFLAIEDQITISLLDRKACPRYACRIVNQIQVGPSPEWLQHHLESLGIKSINNVVDVSNYVMFELGQPLHLFDYDLIDQHHLTITSQTAFQSLETLDHMTREIPPDAVLICDAQKPLCFGGIMGGLKGSVSDNTHTVLIEAAMFTPQVIRKTSKILGLRTDASQRFEKGIDPNAILNALNRAAYLLQEIASGQVSRGIIDIQARHFHRKIITCRIPRVNAILGTQLSLSEVEAIFQRLNFDTVKESKSKTPPRESNEDCAEKRMPPKPNSSSCLYTHALTVQIPTYRNDITAEIDLIEEVARIYGYNHIPKTTPSYVSSQIPPDPIYLLEKTVRQRLIAEGLQECITCDLISPEQALLSIENNLPKESLISVLQPSSIDQSVLRASLLPGALQVIQYNLNRSHPTLYGFEIGKIHFKPHPKSFTTNPEMVEYPIGAIFLTGKNRPYHFDPKPQDVDFFDLKGIVENLFSSLHISSIEFTPSHLHHFHPGRQSAIQINGQIIGALGEVHPQHAAHFNIDQRVYFAQINLHDLIPLIPQQIKPLEMTPFPGSERDWTITLPDLIPIDHILQIIRQCAPPQLEHVYLLDLYKSEQIGKDRKNVTFRFYYREQTKTIDFETVEKEHARLITAVAEKGNWNNEA